MEAGSNLRSAGAEIFLGSLGEPIPIPSTLVRLFIWSQRNCDRDLFSGRLAYGLVPSSYASQGPKCKRGASRRLSEPGDRLLPAGRHPLCPIPAEFRAHSSKPSV